MQEELLPLIGIEQDLDDLNWALMRHVQAHGDSTVGALHVTCSDESEYECISSFQSRFVEQLLPDLKLIQKSAMHTSNLGGRYEWGSLEMARQHYCHPSAHGRAILFIKINSHVGVTAHADGARFGILTRYRRESTACGALDALLHGSALPFTQELRALFLWEGRDRLGMLLDPGVVDPSRRSLFAAVNSVRLQARRAILEIQDHRPAEALRFMVAPCLTFNRHDHDTEMLCGLYTADWQDGRCTARYTGLGDDPSRYTFARTAGRFHLSDDQLGVVRPARNHRALVHRKWRTSKPARSAPNEKLQRLLEDAGDKLKNEHIYSTALLAVLTASLFELAPIPAAMVLFAEGVVQVHHTHRAYHIAQQPTSDAEARHLLANIKPRIEQLPAARARQISERLIRECHAG